MHLRGGKHKVPFASYILPGKRKKNIADMLKEKARGIPGLSHRNAKA